MIFISELKLVLIDDALFKTSQPLPKGQTERTEE